MHLNEQDRWINFALVLEGKNLLAVDQVLKIVARASVTIHRLCVCVCACMCGDFRSPMVPPLGGPHKCLTY